MTLHRDTKAGTTVRWVGAEQEGPVGVIRPGDVGTFIDFDGPPATAEAVVSFPGGTFVCSRDDVEVVPH